MGKLKIFTFLVLLVVFSLTVPGCGIKPVMVNITISWNEFGEVKENYNGDWIEIENSKRSVQPNTSLKLKAFPNEGYEFSEWEIVGADYGEVSNLSKDEIVLTSFQDKAIIEAFFIEELSRHTITFEEKNSRSLSVITIFNDPGRTNSVGANLITDSNGMVNTELPDGEYWWVANLEQYFDQGNFIVQGVEKTIEFELEETPVKGITVIRQPKLSYEEGHSLDLSELVVKVIWQNGFKKEMKFSAFPSYGLITQPQHGQELNELDHDGETVKITHGTLSEGDEIGETGELRVRERERIFYKDFTEQTLNSIPDGWGRTGEEWLVYDSGEYYSFAGGNPPELRFRLHPSQEGTFIVTTPEIDVTDYVGLELIFKQKITIWADSELDFTLKVAISNDSGLNWTTVGLIDPSIIIDPRVTTIILDDSFAGGKIKIAWIYEGNSERVSGWFIDDIILEGLIK